MMKPIFTTLSTILILQLYAQELYFPPNSGNDWESITPAALGWCTDEIDELYEYLETNNSKAFILLKDGKIVIEKYFGTFTQDSLWYWASAGKTLTAFTVGMAQQEGYLSINDTTSEYLGNGWTSCIPGQEEKITIGHQLTMTTGLDDGVPDPFCTLDTCLVYEADAGTRWAYHNAPYTLLDGVIEAATGQSLNAYFHQRIKAPTGMNGAFVPLDYNMVYFSNARSMARFGLLVLAGGNWSGNQLLTDTAYFSQMVNTSQELNQSYGYLWWLNGKPSFMLPYLQFVFPGWICPNAPEDMIAALGKNGQIINVVPSENLVLIRMGNEPAAGEIGITLNDSIWQKLNNVICGSTAIEHIEVSGKTINIFPNPTKGQFSVEHDAEIFDIEIFDLKGRLVHRKTENYQKSKIDLMDQPEGIYVLQVRSNRVTIGRKVVVLRN